MLAVVVDGARALAYVCDGIPAENSGTPPSIAAWFNVPSDGRTVQAAAPAGTLSLALTDTTVTGTLAMPDGRVLQVDGSTVDGTAGLYRGESTSGPKALAGWVVAADGTQRGSVRFDPGGGLGFDPGGGLGLDPGGGIRPLDTRVRSLQLGRTSVSVSKVGITPIPIP